MNTPNEKKTLSLWIATTGTTNFAPLRDNLDVDVAIIGGGITGLTAAALLKKSGKTVVVLDKDRVVRGETGHTTAHITELIDAGYRKIAFNFGREGARIVRESSRAAIDQIAQFIDQLEISCSFTRVPAYVYTESKRDISLLKREMKAARAVGVTGTLMSEEELRTENFPFRGAKAAVRFEGQARFHPREYLLPLARSIDGGGSHVFELTVVTDIADAKDGELCKVTTDHGYVVQARDVIVATDSPISTKAFMHAKIANYRTYVIAVKVREKFAVDGLFWDTDEPYHYTRLQDDLVIIGGEDHKVGLEKDTESRFAALEKYARERFEVEEVRYRWSGQVIEPVDGLPFIGKSPMSKHVYLSTGYNGNGMTLGTVGGMLLSDLVLGHKNPWADLYDSTRVKTSASLVTYVRENKDFAVCFVKDRFKGAEAKSVSDVSTGEGKIVNFEGVRAAVYRDSRGKVHSVSPVCTHMGCYVRFNDSEKSWDCPCHGSRFSIDGQVLHGPANAALEPVAIDEKKRHEEEGSLEDEPAA